MRTYLIGDDVIAQTVDGTTQYLLYDGHGSTRQLAEYDTDVTIVDSFSYDGYGVLLQDNAIASSNPGKVAEQQTNLLYTGEHFDTSAQQYYLRARYYDPLNGRFNRMDPFSGNNQDPQSLHKYLYAHCNPINGIDPSGNFFLTTMISFIWIQAKTLYMRTESAIRSYAGYSKAKSAIKVMAVASVIASAFVTNYAEGAAVVDLTFSKNPMLPTWPEVKFSAGISGGDRIITVEISFDPKQKDPWALTNPSSGDYSAGGIFNVNLTHPENSTISVEVMKSIKVYDKGPIEASLGVGFEGSSELPVAFKMGLGVSFKSPWKALGFDISFSLFRYDSSGLSLLWGINWSGSQNVKK